MPLKIYKYSISDVLEKKLLNCNTFAGWSIKLYYLKHRSGFVNIIGYPNAGKSTLMNELMGEPLSIVTAKEQTTRHRILGMVNGDDFQVVFSDTPGLIDPKYKLQEAMMKTISSAFEDADHLLVLEDLSKQRDFDENLLNRIRGVKAPVTILLNKADLTDQETAEKRHAYWSNLLPEATIRIISALHKFGTKELLSDIVSQLPEGPEYFPKDQLTDRSERFVVSEVVRKHIFEHTSKEVPYASEVYVETFKEQEDIIRIRAIVIVERDTQKQILIGTGGSMMKKIGTAARLELEKFFVKKIFLELFVKVDKDWRKNNDKLKKYGYLPS